MEQRTRHEAKLTGTLQLYSQTTWNASLNQTHSTSLSKNNNERQTNKEHIDNEKQPRPLTILHE